MATVRERMVVAACCVALASIGSNCESRTGASRPGRNDSSTLNGSTEPTTQHVVVHIMADGRLMLDDVDVPLTRLTRELLGKGIGPSPDSTQGGLQIVFEDADMSWYEDLDPVLMQCLMIDVRRILLADEEVRIVRWPVSHPAAQGFPVFVFTGPNDVASTNRESSGLSERAITMTATPETTISAFLGSIRALRELNCEYVLSVGYVPADQLTGHSQGPPATQGSEPETGSGIVRVERGPSFKFCGVLAEANEVVYVCDASESMNVYLPEAKRRLISSIRTLNATQSFAVVVVGDSGPVLIPNGRLVPALEKEKLRAFEQLQKIRASGKANAVPAIGEAFRILRASPGQGKAIFLFTGATSSGGEQLAASLGVLNADRRVPVHVVLCSDSDQSGETERLLKQVAWQNNGRFRLVKTQARSSGGGS